MKAKAVELTRVSPKGQVVIPQGIREELKIETGMKFAVYGRDDTIIFKRIELPTIKDFERLSAFGRVFAKRRRITEKDVLKDD